MGNGRELLRQVAEGAHAATINTKDLLIDGARAVSNSHHAAPIHAMIRQGADEIAQILPAFPESVKPTPETGQMFEPTSQEVFLNRTGRELDIDMDR